MATAFVLSGGGSLAAVWVGLRRRLLFPLRPTRGLLAVFGARESLCSPAPLARLLDDHLTFSRLEDAQIPVHVVATDALTGSEVLLSGGDATSALLASAAIPGIFPSVPCDGRMLCDGALANNSAISQAVALGADRIYVLPSGTACALDRPPRHPLAAAMDAVTLLLQQRAILETRTYAGTVDLHVMPRLCPLSISAMDFSHAATLIGRARRSTGGWLDCGSDQLPYADRFLSLHGHRQVDCSTPPALPVAQPVSQALTS